MDIKCNLTNVSIIIINYLLKIIYLYQYIINYLNYKKNVRPCNPIRNSTRL